MREFLWVWRSNWDPPEDGLVDDRLGTLGASAVLRRPATEVPRLGLLEEAGAAALPFARPPLPVPAGDVLREFQIVHEASVHRDGLPADYDATKANSRLPRRADLYDPWGSRSGCKGEVSGLVFGLRVHERFQRNHLTGEHAPSQIFVRSTQQSDTKRLLILSSSVF